MKIFEKTCFHVGGTAFGAKGVVEGCLTQSNGHVDAGTISMTGGPSVGALGAGASASGGVAVTFDHDFMHVGAVGATDVGGFTSWNSTGFQSVFGGHTTSYSEFCVGLRGATDMPDVPAALPTIGGSYAKCFDVLQTPAGTVQPPASQNSGGSSAPAHSIESHHDGGHNVHFDFHDTDHFTGGHDHSGFGSGHETMMAGGEHHGGAFA